MKGAARESTAKNNDGRNQAHAAQYAKVRDGRKQPIRGLWGRNGRFYAQLKIEDVLTGEKKTRRVPLVDKDGGVVIGKIYGHLANEHKKAMAEKLNFGPVALENAANQ